jgi:hypothetical protein
MRVSLELKMSNRAPGEVLKGIFLKKKEGREDN